MSGVIRKSAVVATSAALAFAGVAGPAVAAGHKGHHKQWSIAKCEKQRGQWLKSHKHPTKKQTAAENKLSDKHGCPKLR